MDVTITCLDAAMLTALVTALRAMGYTPRSFSTAVSFRFATTRSPRSATPALVQAAETSAQGLVNAYAALGLTSNDPNTVRDAALNTITSGVSIYSKEFFTKAVAALANIAIRLVQFP